MIATLLRWLGIARVVNAGQDSPTPPPDKPPAQNGATVAVETR